MDSLADRLKEVRERSRLSQIAFAASLAVSTNTVSNWERGTASPSAENLVLIRQKYQIELDWLLTGERTAPTSELLSSSTPVTPRTVDSKSLQQIIEIVEERVAQAGMTLSPAKKAKLIVLLWEYSVETGKEVGPEIVDRYLELAV